MTKLNPKVRDRCLRGLELYRQHAGKIRRVGPSLYTVPSSDGGHWRVDYRDEKCSCPDFSRRQDTCKHLVAVALYAALARRRAGVAAA